MFNSESIGRLVHVNLATQQRRLRHLRSLSARNIQADKSNGEKDALMETYFTLHTFTSQQAIYVSEKILDSLNPTWRSFDLSRSCDDVDTALPGLMVRVWGGRNEQFKLIIEWKVDLQGLRYLGEYINNDNLKYHPNSLIFGMFDGFYGASEKDRTIQTYGSGVDEKLEVEQNSVSLSYTTYSLSRVHTAQRAIKQTQVSVGKVQQKIEQQLQQSQHKTQIFSEKESLALRVSMLRNEVRHQRKLLKAEKEKADVSATSLKDKVNKFATTKENFKKDKERLKERKAELYKRRELLSETSRNLTTRKRQLIGELSDIYPIVEQQDHTYSILGVKLPNAEDYPGTDDMTIAVALGHTCHLLQMISHIQVVPSRYPMMHLSSRSVIKDHITKVLADKDRDFPLYTKGKERFQFRYAVYLLNRNIAQLRYSLGLSTSDLRATLPNLKSLLEMKWGVNIENPKLTTIYQDQRKHASVATGTQSKVRETPQSLVNKPNTSANQNGNSLISPPPSYESSMKGYTNPANAPAKPAFSGNLGNQNNENVKEDTNNKKLLNSSDQVEPANSVQSLCRDAVIADNHQSNGIIEGADAINSDHVVLTENMSGQETIEANLTGQLNQDASEGAGEIFHFDDIHSRADALQHHRQSFSSFRASSDVVSKNSKENKKL
ncbi:UV radiation resistance-associated protein-like [Anneissia japonica]|uniref:UV radiation resistance-associated protein-like n=1 Tax=Anneissia japonica TaxID=1529436 RepID=UPI001425A881|nr:UV radiation resistance-associated protein-like [Anneissia japonica]